MENKSDAISRKLEDPDFQWKLFKILCIAVCALTISNAVLAGAGIWQHFHPPKEHFFYSDSIHKPYEIESLANPVENESKLVSDVGQWVVETYSIDFLNYKDDLSRASRHYTANGWYSFGTQLQASGNLEEIKKARLSSRAIPERAPVIIDKDVVGDRYTYKIQVPLLVTFMNSQQQNQQHLLATTIVVRTPVSEHSEGYAIDQINAPPA